MANNFTVSVSRSHWVDRTHNTHRRLYQTHSSRSKWKLLSNHSCLWQRGQLILYLSACDEAIFEAIFASQLEASGWTGSSSANVLYGAQPWLCTTRSLRSNSRRLQAHCSTASDYSTLPLCFFITWWVISSSGSPVHQMPDLLGNCRCLSVWCSFHLDCAACACSFCVWFIKRPFCTQYRAKCSIVYVLYLVGV